MSAGLIAGALLVLGILINQVLYQLLLRKMERLKMPFIPDNSPGMGFNTNIRIYIQQCSAQGISLGKIFWLIVINFTVTCSAVIVLLVRIATHVF